MGVAPGHAAQAKPGLAERKSSSGETGTGETCRGPIPITDKTPEGMGKERSGPLGADLWALVTQRKEPLGPSPARNKPVPRGLWHFPNTERSVHSWRGRRAAQAGLISPSRVTLDMVNTGFVISVLPFLSFPLPSQQSCQHLPIRAGFWGTKAGDLGDSPSPL